MNESSSKIYAAFTAAAILLAAPAAYAFTIDDGSGKSPNGASKNAAPSPFYDSSKKYDLETKDSDGNSFKFGGGSMTLGPVRSPDDDYRRNVDRMFNPLGRPGQ